MAWLSVLDRFRPVGAPGPAGPVGVPSHDDQGPAAELGAVFAALAPDVEFCREIVAAAHRDADTQLMHAREQATARVATARLGAAEVRAGAAANVTQLAAGHDAEVVRQADADAAAIRQAGDERMPALVKTIVDALLADELAL